LFTIIHILIKLVDTKSHLEPDW